MAVNARAIHYNWAEKNALLEVLSRHRNIVDEYAGYEEEEVEESFGCLKRLSTTRLLNMYSMLKEEMINNTRAERCWLRQLIKLGSEAPERRARNLDVIIAVEECIAINAGYFLAVMCRAAEIKNLLMARDVLIMPH